MSGAGQRAPRAIVVGAGLMGRWHANAVRRSGYRVAAVVDPDSARARAIAASHRGARVGESLVGMLEPGDVVHVCSPAGTHVPLALQALDAGCHVLVEKPVAPTADDTARLLARAAAVGRLLVPVHQYLFQAGVRRAAGLLTDVGPVLHVDAVACTAGADGRDDDARDRLAIEVLPHALSLLARLLDPGVDTVGWAVLRPSAGELRATGALAGATVSLTVSTHGRPTRNVLRLTCARGTLSLDLFHGFATCVAGPPSRTFKVAHPFIEAAHAIVQGGVNLTARAVRGDVAYPGLRELVRATYRAAERGTHARDRMPISDGETIAVARALDLITARFMDGRETPVPSSGASPAAGRPVLVDAP